MRVLLVTHGASVPGGVFEEVAEAGGHALERWSVPDGAPPGTALDFDAVMVFGGSMHPDQDDRFAWLEREEEFLRDVLARRIPVLGVCLGAQMLARAAGARVGPAAEPEIGWLEVQLTEEGASDPVLGALPTRIEAFQWHHYTFAVPPGAAELARSALCTQAFGIDGHAWGIQFHAEVTLGMLENWASQDDGELPVRPEDFVAAARARIAGWNEHGRRLSGAFLEVAASR